MFNLQKASHTFWEARYGVCLLLCDNSPPQKKKKKKTGARRIA